VGKSNLLASMALGDAANGHGLALIDPKGDLVETVLARLPDKAANRVIVLDPAASDWPVGFNPLYVPGADEHARELAADRVLHIFKDLFRANWGPRSDDIMRAVLLTLVSVPAPNGQAFTICEAPELLVRPELRRYVMKQPGLPELLKSYWAGFDGMSDAERSQHAGPVLNKLRAFTMRTATRLMLGQSVGIDLTRVMAERRILLVSLAKGRVGEETANLAGSLLMAALWQAALGRANIEPEARRPFYLFLDEFQDVVRLSSSLPDLLAQARGLGVGAVLANQYLAQLPDAVQKAVLGTVRSQVAFQVEYDDAKLLERRFAPDLAASDLMGLGRYEIALRPSVNGETAGPVTGVTQPLPEPVREAVVLAEASRAEWGQARTEVERELAARIEPPRGPRRGGRVPGGPGA
jgi:type IV secretory pathway TraG/TraD family ATPase VirD4